MSFVIRDGVVVTSAQTFRADVLITGEKIEAIGLNLEAPNAEVIDAAGKYVLPGGIDVHTHLDMPLGAISSSDDFYTGHVAAAFGGTTTHLDFANQAKGESLHDALETWHAKARSSACIDYGFHVTISDLTNDVLHEIETLPEQGITTIKMLMAYKGRLQVDDTTLFRAMECARDNGILTMVHCENGDAIDLLIKKAVAAGQTEPKYHALTRPPQLEGEATGRAIALAEVLDAPLYVVHVTCEPAVARIREARGRGARVWGETCIQYLFFTQDDLDRPGFDGAKWVCSPPFRERNDQEVLWAALRDGNLSVVSTDHCPFFYTTQKTLGKHDFTQIPNGIPSIEERLMLLHGFGVQRDRIDLNRFVALTATNPARLFGLGERKGSIAPGYDADIAIWDMDREQTFRAETAHSHVDYNLFEGMTVRGVPERVLLRGRVIVDNGSFIGEPGAGQFLHRARFTH